jgi:glutathione S-transferase
MSALIVNPPAGNFPSDANDADTMLSVGLCYDYRHRQSSTIIKQRKPQMYTLYSYPVSQHARRVIALLEIAGLKYQIEHVALEDWQHVSPEFLAINPNHQIPTLVDGEIKIHESNAILRYLCLKHGLTDWYPQGMAERAATEQWLDWCQCQLGWAVIDIVLNSVFLGEDGDQKAIERGQKKLAELRPILDDHLADRKFFIGDKPTIVDLAIASNITHLAFANAMPTEKNILAWLDRVTSIEGFRKTIPQQLAA